MRLAQHINQQLYQRLNLKRFFRGEGPETGPVTLLQRRVYILPTKMGLYFAAIMLMMLLGSINYNNSLGYALTFLLASLSIVAILHTYRNLLHLRLDVGHIPPVFCGETLFVPVSLDNSNKTARYAVRLQFPDEKRVFVDIPADHWRRADIPLRTQARGQHALPRITLRTTFPLDLFQAWSHVQFHSHYLIYPQADKHHPLPQESAYHLNLSGDRGQGSDDFAGLRNYHEGDSLRHVHWKAVAREQGMHTKQFGGDRAEELWLDWATLPKLDVEQRLSRLARWVVDAEASQLSYGLRIPGTQIPLGHGPAHRHLCLKSLALFQASDQVDSGPGQ